MELSPTKQKLLLLIAIFKLLNYKRTGEVVWPLNQVAGAARRHLQEFQQVR